MDDQIGFHHLFQRGAEGSNKLGRQIGDKTDRVRQDHLVMPRQLDGAHGGIERGEQQILGAHLGTGEPVEQGGFAGVGIANQCHHRPRRLLALLAVQAAGAAHFLQFLAQPGNAVADQAPVSLDLRFAGTAQEAEAAALAFKVGPAAHQAAGLILQMRQFHLQRAFRRAGALAKNFQDEPGAIDHLGLQQFFKIALLNRGDGAIDDDHLGLHRRHQAGQTIDLAAAQQARDLHVAQLHHFGMDNIERNGTRQTLRLGQLGFGRTQGVAGFGKDVRQDDQRARTRADAARFVEAADGQFAGLWWFVTQNIALSLRFRPRTAAAESPA